MRLAGSLAIAALLPVLYAQEGGAVEGVVVNSVTGVGIGGATVRLLFRQDHYETVTDGAGAFRISGIKPGDYATLVEKLGYSTPASQFGRTIVHIGSEKEPVRLHLELAPLATLRGRVFGIDGNPAARAKVDVGGSRVITAGDDGSFAFENLPPGVYILIARPAASTSFTQDGVRTEVLPTYFPSVLDPSAAQEIRLQPAWIKAATTFICKRRRCIDCEESCWIRPGSLPRKRLWGSYRKPSANRHASLSRPRSGLSGSRELRDGIPLRRLNRW